MTEHIKVLSERLGDLLEYDKPITQETLKNTLKTDARTIRKAIKLVNDNYNKGLTDFVIIGTFSGNIKTKNKKLIATYNQRKRKHALSELKSAYNCDKRLNRLSNISFFEYLEHIEKKG